MNIKNLLYSRFYRTKEWLFLKYNNISQFNKDYYFELLINNIDTLNNIRLIVIIYVSVTIVTHISITRSVMIFLIQSCLVLYLLLDSYIIECYNPVVSQKTTISF